MYQRVSTFSFQCQVRVGVLGKTLEPRQLGKVVTAAAEDTDTALDTCLTAELGICRTQAADAAACRWLMMWM